MPKVCSEGLRWRDNSGETQVQRVDIHVNADGLFYIPLMVDDDEKEALYQWCRGRDGIDISRRPKGRVWVTAATKNGLAHAYTGFLRSYNEYSVEEEQVILYVIGSRVSYAVNAEGAVEPNAGYPGFSWAKTDDRFDPGPTHSNFYGRAESEHGFMVLAGAKAMTKKTMRRGEHTKTEYESWNGPGRGHLDHDHPAGRLNAWLVSLPEDCEEMPYTDEAAIFFDKLMMGMVQMARQIDQVAGDQEKLLHLIETGMPLLGGPS